MRIIAGKLKGTNLLIPKDKNTRPLKDITRESIFNLLIHSKKISFQFENSNILDLYAGTGSFGLECLSRKVKSVSFVEKNKKAFKILKKNIEKLDLNNETKIFYDDVLRIIKKKKIKSKFDLIFCDPPFIDNNVKQLITLIFNTKLLEKNGTIILHRKKTTKEELPDYFKILDERVYGLSKIIFGNFLS